MIYAVIASICWGFAYYLSGKILEKNVSVFTFYLFSFPTTIALCFYALINTTAKQDLALLMTKENIWLVVGQVLFTILGGLLVSVAMKETNTFLATIMEIMYPLVIMGILLFKKEIQLDWVQVAGAIIAVLGISLVVYKR